MTLQMGITMAVLIFMIISFFVGKYSYGLISMTCVIILTLTGVVMLSACYLLPFRYCNRC